MLNIVFYLGSIFQFSVHIIISEDSAQRKYGNFSFTCVLDSHRKFSLPIILKKTTQSCWTFSVHIFLTEMFHSHRKFAVHNIRVQNFLQRLALQKNVCLLSSVVCMTICCAYYSFRIYSIENTATFLSQGLLSQKIFCTQYSHENNSFLQKIFCTHYSNRNVAFSQKIFCTQYSWR